MVKLLYQNCYSKSFYRYKKYKEIINIYQTSKEKIIDIRLFIKDSNKYHPTRFGVKLRLKEFKMLLFCFKYRTYWRQKQNGREIIIGNGFNNTIKITIFTRNSFFGSSITFNKLAIKSIIFNENVLLNYLK